MRTDSLTTRGVLVDRRLRRAVFCRPRASLAGAEQTEAPAPRASDVQVTSEEVASRLKQLDEAKDLDDAAKAKVQELYQEALQQLELARTRTNQAKDREKQAVQASEQLQATRAELGRPRCRAATDRRLAWFGGA